MFPIIWVPDYRIMINVVKVTLCIRVVEAHHSVKGGKEGSGINTAIDSKPLIRDGGKCGLRVDEFHRLLRLVRKLDGNFLCRGGDSSSTVVVG